MRRFMFLLFALIIASALLVSCGSSNPKVAASNPSAMEVIEDPFQDLTDLSNKFIESGGVAAVGQGTSMRQDLAKKKAVTDALGNLAQVFNTKVQRLQRSFQEEIGSTNDSEINEAFSTVTKTLTSQVLRGATPKKVKYMRNKETGQITAAVVVAIDPKTLNQAILDELQNKKPQLYQRFRATKAYEDLKKEMEEYEKQQNQGF